MFVQTQDLFTPFKCIIIIETQKMSQGQVTFNVTQKFIRNLVNKYPCRLPSCI